MGATRGVPLPKLDVPLRNAPPLNPSLKSTAKLEVPSPLGANRKKPNLSIKVSNGQENASKVGVLRGTGGGGPGRNAIIEEMGEQEDDDDEEEAALESDVEEDRIMQGKPCWLSCLYGRPVLKGRILSMVILAGLLLVMTIVIYSYTSAYTRHSVGHVALPLRAQMLNRTVEKMSNLIVRHRAVHQAMKLRLEEGDIFNIDNTTRYPNPNDFKRQVVRALWSFINTAPEVQIVAMLLPGGRSVQILRDKLGMTSIFANSSSNVNILWWLEPLDNNGLPTGGGMYVPGLDLASKPGYNENLKLFGTQVAIMGLVTDVSPQLQIVTTVNNTNTGLLGALVLTINMDDLRIFMSSLDLLGGKMYFFDRNQQIVSLSDATITYKKDPVTGVTSMVHVTEVNNTLVARSATYLEHKHTLASLYEETTHATDVELMGKKYYIDSAPLAFPDLSIQLVGVIIVPRSSIMGNVDRGTKGTLEFIAGLATGVFVVGCGLILLATHYMTSEMRLKTELFAQLKAKERAEAVIEASRLFLANLSHDLRTPMAGIIGLLEILVVNGLDVEQSNIVSNIMSTANTLHSLLNSILDLSKMEMGQLSLDLVPFSLRESLELTVDLFSVEMMNKGIEIVLDMPDELPNQMMGDPMRVGQVFTNLLSNCVKFTESGHIIIRGTLLRRIHRDDAKHAFKPPSSPTPSGKRNRSSSRGSSRSNSRRNSVNTNTSVEITPQGSFLVERGPDEPKKRKVSILFEVTDTGKEVPVEHREAIFENFVQLPDKHSRYGGTGFGLGIVRSLVHLMGGSISIVDKGMPGCTFSFNLVFWEIDPPAFPTEGLQDPTLGHKSQVPLPMNLSEVDGAGVLALLAMPDSIGRTSAAKWLTVHGVTVWQVSALAEVVHTARGIWAQMTSPLGVEQASIAKPGWGQLTSKKFLMMPSFRMSPDGEVVMGVDRQGAEPATIAAAGDSSPPKGGVILLDIRLVPEPVSSFFESGGGFALLLEQLHKATGEHSPRVPLVVAWLVATSTPANVQRTIRHSGCIVLQKPMYATRLASLLCQVTSALPLVRSNASLQPETKPPARLEALSPPDPVQAPVVPPKPSPLLQSPKPPSPPRTLQPPPTIQQPELPPPPLKAPLEIVVQAPEPPPPTPPAAALSKAEPLQIEAQAQPPPSTAVESTEKAPEAQIVPGGAEGLKAEGGTQPPPSAAAPEAAPAPKAVGRTAKVSDGGGEKGVGAAEMKAGEGPSGPPKSADPAMPLGGIRVLLVEDTPLMARVATLHLKKLGATVSTVTDGQQAVDSMLPSYAADLFPAKGPRNGKSFIQPASVSPSTSQALPNGRLRPGSTLFDFVLMDCQMPVLDGYGATQEIRRMDQQRLCHTPIIALTAHAMASDKQKCLDCGMDAYLTKPLQPPALVKICEELGLVKSP